MKYLFYIVVMFFYFSNTFAKESIYYISINDINGNLIDLKKFKGKYILFVNVVQSVVLPQILVLKNYNRNIKII